MTEWLTPDELREMTGYVRSGAQKRWLDAAGIPSHPRADGSLCVFRADLGARGKEAEPRRSEPNFAAVRRAG